MNSITITVTLNDRDALIDASNKFRMLAGESPTKLTTSNPLATELSQFPLTPENVTMVADKIKASTEIPDQTNGEVTYGVQVDGNGLPWDHRIHSSSKRLTKKGVWQIRKNLTEDYIKQIESELRAAMAIPSPATQESATTVAPPPPATQESTSTVAPPPPKTEEPEEPEEPTTTVAPPPPKTEEPEEPVYIVDGKEFKESVLLQNGWSQDDLKTNARKVLTFPQFMAKITQALTQNQITNEQVDAAIKAVGLASKPLLSSRPDLIPQVDKALFPNG